MKYMGSKSRIAKDLAPIIQSYIDNNNIKTYIEPFVGGANMIDKIECDEKIGCDIHEYVIALLNALKDGWTPPMFLDEETYSMIKLNKCNYPMELVGYAGFQLSYGAKWFGGYRRDKVGKRKYDVEAYNNVVKQMNSLNGIVFKCLNYQDLKVNSSVIYCDPPYSGTTKYKDKFDHDVYWEWVREMSKNNIVLCSEYNAPNDFECIWEKEVTTGLDNKSRKKDVEKLFIHKSKLI